MTTIQIKELLNNRNLKATSTRLNLLSKMIKYGSAMSYSSIQNQMNPIDRVTLFRILSCFEKKGIIHSIRLENGQHLYAVCKETCRDGQHSHQHIHFTCESCDDVSCLSIDNFPNLSLTNYKFNNININVSGVCQSCVI